MSISTIAEFKAFARKADEPSGEANYQMFLDSANSVIVDYLCYNPEEDTHIDTVYGDGKPYLNLSAPIVSLTSLTIDGVAGNIADYTLDFNTMTEKDGNPFAAGSKVIVTYTGGLSDIPAMVKHTELQIASLMSMEMGEQIGTTGSTFDGGNSRTFVSYTKFDKYLSKLAPLRLTLLPRLA